MNKIRTKEEEEFRKKRKERTIKSLSRAAKVKHRRRRWNKVRKKRPYIRQAIYQIGERNEGTKETVVGSKKKKLSSSRFFIHLSKRSLFVSILFIIRFPILLSPSLPPSPLVPRFGKLSTSNEGIYRFSRSILVYLFYVSRVVTRRPPPLCEISG